MLGVECMHLHETIHTTIERRAGLVDREKCVHGLDRNNSTDKTDRTEDVDLTKKHQNAGTDETKWTEHTHDQTT